MLYDKRWDAKVEVQHPSLQGLIAWLEGMPPEREYNWRDCKGGCLIGLYGKAMGIGKRWRDFHGEMCSEGELWVASTKPYTFGAALDRARDALARRR